MDIYDVSLSKRATNDLFKVPRHVVKKLHAWIDNVNTYGLREVRKVPGYHDEPLHGVRQGQRSIRLSKAYRAIYEIQQNGSIEIVLVLEVNKHEY
jgi:proteic killer suppression protein